MDLQGAPPSRRQTVRTAVRTLHPSYFALVMATGIVSVGLRDRGVPALSTALMWLAVLAYVVLVVVNGWRAAVYRREVRHDVVDPARGFGFFTFVAGTGVLATRLVLADHRDIAVVLLVVGGLGWLALGYLIPWGTFGGAGRAVVAEANGTWFVWVVATQSVAVVAATLQPVVSAGRAGLALLAACCWSIGVFLYVAVGILVTARLLRYDLRPADLTPPYWVAMGATAIIVLAGAQIVRMADVPARTAMHGLVTGASVAFWAFGTWLIPSLLAAGWWRHVTHRVPLRYEASWWSIVFPLGMYAVASEALGNAVDLPIVAAVGRHEIWLALTTWTVAFGAMLVHLGRTLGARPGHAATG